MTKAIPPALREALEAEIARVPFDAWDEGTKMKYRNIRARAMAAALRWVTENTEPNYASTTQEHEWWAEFHRALAALEQENKGT